MQSVVQSSLHIFSPVGKGQGNVLTSGNDRHQSSICTVGREWVQWDHLRREVKNILKNKWTSERLESWTHILISIILGIWQSTATLMNSAISESTQYLTTWKLSSVIPLFSRWRIPWRVRYVRTSTSSRSRPPSGIQQSCFHTQGARCKSRGFLVRMATAMRMPRKRNCTMWSSNSAAGLNRNLSG